MKRTLYILFFLLLPKVFYAQDFKFRTDRNSKIVKSKDVIPGTVLNLFGIEEDKWADLVANYTLAASKYKFKSVENIVRIGIDPDYPIAVPAYKYLIHLDVTGYDYKSYGPGPIPYVTNSVILELSYNPDSLQTYKGFCEYRQTGFHRFEASISSIETVNLTTGAITPLISDLAPNFYMEAIITWQRYDLEPKKFALRNDPDPSGRSLKVTWGLYNESASAPCILPDAITSDEYKPVIYELEYCYIDDYKYNLATNTPSNSLDASGAAYVQYNFRDNSTRVQITEGRNFTIPLVYEKGAIMYRVRTVRPSPSNYSDIIYGDWSLPGDEGSMNVKDPCFAKYGYVIPAAHARDSLNWQYTINFAEEGKYKQVINYFDGALKDRQTQTKINTDKNYIVAVDKAYDYEGRPAIVSLPTPVNGQADLYYRNDILLNKATSQPYRAQDFDVLGCVKPDSIAPLSDNALAAKYYSPLNPDQSGMQQFVPDAKGYPMVQTVYSPDNTNKVRFQGGAGWTQQAFKGHATQYEYTRPQQQELDRILGTEAGNAQYYPKQVVTDPNGQSSFSIMDPKGKVVISGLQGPAPDSSQFPVDTLTNYARGKRNCQDLLLDYKQDKTQNTLEATLPFYNDVQGNASFKYSVKTIPFPTACSGQYLWAAAQYSLTVTDDCGKKISSLTGSAGESKVTASNGNAYTSGTAPVTSMPKGNYLAGKKLSFSAYDIHHLVDSFVYANEPACYKDVYYFVKQAVDSTKFPCTAGIDTNSNTTCDQARAKMIKELYPNAKYGLYAKNADSSYKKGVANSIFSTIGQAKFRTILESGVKTDGKTTLDLYESDLVWTSSYDKITYGPAIAWNLDWWIPGTPRWIAGTDMNRAGYYTDPGKTIRCPEPTGYSYFRATINIDSSVNIDSMVFSDFEMDGDLVTLSVNGILQFDYTHGGLPLALPRKITGLNYGSNQLDLTIFNSLGQIGWWGKFSEKLPLCAYQGDCVLLPDTVVKDGEVYTNLKALPVQTFIEIFNDDIAAALLPLHPEYCKLLNCDGGAFEAMLEKTISVEQALTNNMFSLDSLIAHDPLKLRGTSGIEERLARLQSLSPTRIDTFALQQAYCSAGNNSEVAYCLADNYKYEIDHFIFRNPEVKQRYFDYLKSLYIGNRTFLLQQQLDGTAKSCGPCTDTRLTLKGIPVFPSMSDALSAGTGIDPDAVPGSASSIDEGDAGKLPGWLKDLFNKAIAKDTNGLSVVPDSLQALYDTTQGAFAEAQADAFMKHLKNCTLNESVRSNMYSTLLRLFKSTAPLTPDRIKSMLVDTFSLTLSDLCHPFLVSYSLMPDTRAAATNFACEDDGLYSGMLAFLQRAVVTGEINTAPAKGTPSALVGSASFALDAGNLFEQKFGASATVTAYTESMGSSCTDCFTTLIIAGTLKTDTLNFSARDAGTALHTALAGTYTVQHVRCLNSDSKAIATGMLAQYSAVLDLACPVCPAPQSYYVWSRSTPLMKSAPAVSELRNSLTCMDMKKAIEDFKADQGLYQYSEATNHPLYAYTLTNYLNRKFNKDYGFGEYTALMGGCAVTDQVALKRQIAGYRIVLNNESDATAFVNTLNTYGTFKPAYLRYKPAAGVDAAKHVFLVDFNSIAEDTLLAYKKLLDGAAGVTISGVTARVYNYSLADDNTTLLFTSSTCSFTPSSFAPVVTTDPNVSVWEADGYNANYKLHTLRQSSGATALQEANMIAGISDYLHNTPASPTCNTGYHFFGRELMRSSDYNTTLKQQYLAYIYGLPPYTHDGMIAAIDPAVLGSHLAAYTTGTFTYDDPYCEGSRTHLYVYNPSPSPLPAGYDLAKNTILSAVGGTLFPDKDFSVVTALGSRLAVIRKASGEYWYRYFDAANKMYNLYITPPSGALAIPLKSFSFSTASVKMGPHPNTFYVDVTYGGTTVRCKGRADFALGNSAMAENVILDKSAKGVSCADSLDCEFDLLARAKENGRAAYRQYFDSAVSRISDDMMVHLLNTTKDTLIYCGWQQQYQQTLYYYDLAGNLTRTIPPAGIVQLDTTVLPAVISNRNGAAPANKMTAHTKASTYTYNSLNQLKYQYTPDGGTIYYFYDAAGRQIFSQNSKQRPTGHYTYSLYDEQGRPAETGEVQLGCAVPATSTAEFDTSYCTYYTHSGAPIRSAHPDFVAYAFNENVYTYAELTSYIKAKPRREVVVTTYDEPTQDLSAISGEMLSKQEHLRSRVAAVRYYTALTSPVLPAEHSFATYFSYDIGGNVKTIAYDYPQLKTVEQQYKRVDYDYDLVSGKINMISYNRGYPDQYYQQYDYDADNRITLVQTSSDGLLWNKDARYTYYKHGPLATLKLGNQKVQSIEYAYTIQGWLKAINGEVLNVNKDMGKTGLSLSTAPMPAEADATYARDVVAHALQYYKDDYAAIGAAPVVTLPVAGKSLYNGNIAQQTTGIAQLGTLQRTYQYDQLQRLTRATNQKVDDATATLATSPANLFKSTYSYDKDGNIKTLSRYDGAATPGLIDNFTYNYEATATKNNKLLQVTDAAGATAGTDLQPLQPVDNYAYDRTGNLIRDKQGAELITWDHFGKVSSIYDSVSKRKINFGYDGRGNRIWKEVLSPDGRDDNHEGEYYVRDAGGNLLAVYRTHSVYSIVRLSKIANPRLMDLPGGIVGGTKLDDVLIGMSTTSLPGAMKSEILGSHGSWTDAYTDRPVSFYTAADPGIRSSLIYSGSDWIDALRAANPAVYTNAFRAAGSSAQPLFTAALDYSTEGSRIAELYSKNMSAAVCEPLWSTAQASYSVGDPATIFSGLTGTPVSGSGNVLYDALATLSATAYPAALRNVIANAHSTWMNNYTDSKPISYYMAIDGNLKSNLLFSGEDWINALRDQDPVLHREALLDAAMQVKPVFDAVLGYQTEGIRTLQYYSATMPPPVCQNVWQMAGAQYMPGNDAFNANMLFSNLNMNPQMRPMIADQLLNGLMQLRGSENNESANFYDAFISDNMLWNSYALRTQQGGVLTQTVRMAVNDYGNAGGLGTFFDGWNGSAAALGACTPFDYKINALYNSNPSVVQDDMSREVSRSEIATILSSIPGLSATSFGTSLVNAGAAQQDVDDIFTAAAADPAIHTANATALMNSMAVYPQLKATVAAELAANLSQAPSGAANFFTAMIADNSLWQSSALRASNGPWTTTIRDLTYSYADPNAVVSFFDSWSGGSSALFACTTPQFRLNTVYASNPARALIDMRVELGVEAVSDLMGAMPDLTIYSYYDRIVGTGMPVGDVAEILRMATTGDTVSLAEHHLYGSSRLGVQRYDSTTLANILWTESGDTKRALKARVPWYSYSFDGLIDSTARKEVVGNTVNAYNGKLSISRTLGRKYFEVTDHLGNVLATVLDRRTGASATGAKTPDGTAYDHWHADLASVTDYYPGGMMMPGRNTEYSWSRIGAQNSPKDDEVYGKGNFIDMGDRHLDTRILRTPRTDEKATKYPHMSPYSYANNNPILFVDPNGKDNVIYLLTLPSGKAVLTPKQISDIAAQATQNFADMGLKTKVVVFDGGANNFDISKIDKTDAVAVFGEPTQIADYVTKKMNAKFGADLKKWNGGPNNPEHSDNEGGKYDANIIALDAPSLNKSTSEIGMADEKNPIVKLGALLINHGAGHNAGQNHLRSDGVSTNTRSVIMRDGTGLRNYLTSNGAVSSGLLNNNVPSWNKDPQAKGQNNDFVNAMKKRFGENVPKVNYDPKGTKN